VTPERKKDPTVDRRYLELPVDLAQRLDKAAAVRTLGWRAIVVEATARFLDQLEATTPFPPRQLLPDLRDAREAHASEPPQDPRALEDAPQEPDF
jgi:hypothetical protein